MPSKNHNKTNPIASGRWLYEYIMREIEPDLLLEQSVLDERYKNESRIDRAARMEHYEQAFKEFDRILGSVTHAIAMETRKEKEQHRSTLGLQEHTQMQADAAAAEASLDTFDA